MPMLEIADGLKTNLSKIQGLRVFALKELPDSVNDFPTALILPGETAYKTTLSSANADYTFRIILLFSKQDQPSAIRKMIEYLAPSGDKSIVARIQADRTLDGKCDDCSVTLNLGVSSLAWGGMVYLSTEFIAQVWAD